MDTKNQPLAPTLPGCPELDARLDRAANERRAAGRLPIESLGTSLGLMQDFSARGIRVQATKVPKGIFPLLISDGVAAVTVNATAAWSKKVGFRRREVGLAFVGLDDDTRREVTNLAMSGWSRRHVNMRRSATV